MARSSPVALKRACASACSFSAMRVEISHSDFTSPTFFRLAGGAQRLAKRW